MTLPFKGTYRLTQGFGLNPGDYLRFGLKGHNGLDYALPSGTPLYAPHDGTIIEVANEGNDGYGKYIKIENSKEGSLLAHLQESKVKVGENVSQGQLIGYSDNTGNSTGPHLHWGYYTLPRNRQNGYAGFVDQLPMIGGGSMANIYKGLDLSNSDSMKVAVDVWDAVVNKNEYIKKSDAVSKEEFNQLNKQLVECRNRPTGNPEAERKLNNLRNAIKEIL